MKQRKSFAVRLSALVLALLLFALLCACAKQPEEGDPTKPQTTVPGEDDGGETRIYPDLPEVKYDYDFKFLHWEVNDWIYWEEIAVKDYSADVLESAVFNRNAKIEQDYGVKISVDYDLYTQVRTTYENMFNTGGEDYDVVLIMGHDLAGLYSKNLMYDITSVPCIDLTKPWWDENCTESLTMGGMLQAAISDITVLDKGSTACVFFNKQLANDLSISGLYNLVDDKEWTIGKMIELCEIASSDLNEDSVYDNTDQYGLLGGDMMTTFYQGAGLQWIGKDSDGFPVNNFDSDSISLCQDLLDTILMRDDLYFNEFRSGTSGTMFQENRALFSSTKVSSGVIYRSMETDYGILPVPMYSDDQDMYYNNASAFGDSLITIPSNASDVKRTGVILEALSAESKYTVQPSFYEKILKDRQSRDEESVRMLDLIFSNRVYDIGEYYDVGGFTDSLLRITSSGSTNVASFYEGYRSKIDSALEDINRLIAEWTK